MSSLLTEIELLSDWAVRHRRHLHRFPELSCEERETSAYCAKILTELGYQITPSWGYGFTADLLSKNASSSKKIKRIAIRADMDALPIQEKNTHDFVSNHDGKAHVCGHDGHMTIALTAARYLAELKQPLPCHVRFIFQPSEERPPGGAAGAWCSARPWATRRS